MTGENGILTQASKAKEESENAKRQEEKILKELEEKIAKETEAENLTPWSGNIATEFAGGNGTEADPYIIENGEQLAYLASQVNGGKTYAGKYIKIVKSINLGNLKWTPIGIGNSGYVGEADWQISKSGFNGNLDGEGNVITGINIVELEINGVGLIGILGAGGTVENIEIYKGNIIGQTCVAGIVGLVNNGNVKNCSNGANIVAQDNETNNSGQYAGGIVGRIERGSIEDCENNGSVVTKDDMLTTIRGKYAGGIVGIIGGKSEIVIKRCVNRGEVTCMYQEVGGIAGSNEYATNKSVIQDCINEGKITAKYQNIGTTALKGGNAGGIIGWIGAECIVNNCTNRGEVIAENQQVGGITGKQTAGTISSCSNSGKIIAKHLENVSSSGIFVGGITGIQTAGTISECNNNGEVIAEKQQAGGIVGQQKAGTVSGCSNNGKIIVKCQENVNGFGIIAGGIIAYMNGEGIVNNCSNSGEVTVEKQSAGGIVGKQTAGTISNCCNSGSITAYSQGVRGISGGILAVQVGGEISKVYNIGKVSTGDYESGIDVAGGIIGQQNTGSLKLSYNKGEITGVEAIGSIVGAKKLAGEIEKTYYYTNTIIKGIGSESDETTTLTPVDDVQGKTEKINDNIENFEKFLEWIQSKI